MYSDIDTKLKSTFILLGIGILIIIVCHVINATKWNDGYCSCGGKWEYQQAVGHRYETMYLYQCDTCGRTEEFYEKYE